MIAVRGSQGSGLWRFDRSWQRAAYSSYPPPAPTRRDHLRRPLHRQQPKRIDEYPDRRDCAPAYLCDHFASRRRQDHLDREIAAVQRAIQLEGEVKARAISVSSAVMSFEHAAEGIEEQIRTLFEVCRLRDVTMVTIRKLPHSHAMFPGHSGY